MNPIGSAVSMPIARRGQDEAPKEWIDAAKQELCKYLAQVDLSRVPSPELIQVNSIRKSLLRKGELGIAPIRLGEVGYNPRTYDPRAYDGYRVVLQYGGKDYPANVARWRGRLKIYFPKFLVPYCPDLTQALILKLIQEIADRTNHPIDPKDATVFQSRKVTVKGADLTENYGRDAFGFALTSMEAYAAHLEIGPKRYTMIMTKDGKRARNSHLYELHGGVKGKVDTQMVEDSTRPEKKRAVTFQGWKRSTSLLNGGKVFNIPTCPRKIVAIAKGMIGREPLELIKEKKVTFTFKEQGAVPGWRLTFQSDQGEHEICIDAEGANSVC